jgi:hypothetical protein
MEESNIALPAWLPWATTAILAVAVACIGERLMIEKAKTQLLRDEASLSASALKNIQNQLEAEQIVSTRELSRLGADFNIEMLAPPRATPSRTCGAVVWKPTSPKAALTLFNMPKRPLSGDYQLWVLYTGAGAHPHPTSCTVFQVTVPSPSYDTTVNIPQPQLEGIRFVLFFGKKGGAATLAEAKSEGSIVLASPSWDGRINDP